MIAGAQAQRGSLGMALVLAWALGGCATQVQAPASPAAAPPAVMAATSVTRPLPKGLPAPRPGAAGEVLGHNERLLVYRPVAGDNIKGVATRFLGDAQKSWMIEEANPVDALQPGQALLVPLRPLNPLGVGANGADPAAGVVLVGRGVESGS